MLAAATLAIIMATALFFPAAHPIMDLWPVFAATLLLAFVGAVDDIVSLPTLPRFLLQVIAVAVVVAWLPSENRIVPILPWWLERLALVVGGVWFVNLVNFMDGLDWMTVAEMLPVTVALAAFGFAGAIPADCLAVALALAGALVGFAPFNRPMARLFMGDVGSLPIGLLTAWCLVGLAGHGHLAAALLLPLYYLVDATTTLIMRLRLGEKVWVAHRTHFYQRATENGFAVIDVVRDVFVLNIALAALAAGTIALNSSASDLLLLAMGAVAVTLVLRRFARPRPRR